MVFTKNYKLKQLEAKIVYNFIKLHKRSRFERNKEK